MNKTETNKLREWCYENPEKVRYLTAYMWMRRNNASAAQTIERYSRPRLTIKQKCEAAGVSHQYVANQMHLLNLTVEQAIGVVQSKNPRRQLNIRPVADKYGLSYRRIYYQVNNTGCTPEEAARYIIDKDRKEAEELSEKENKKPGNDMATKEWV